MEYQNNNKREPRGRHAKPSGASSQSDFGANGAPRTKSEFDANVAPRTQSGFDANVASGEQFKYGAAPLSSGVPTKSVSSRSADDASGSTGDTIAFGSFDPNAVASGTDEACRYSASNYGSGAAKRAHGASGANNGNLVKVRRKKRKSHVGLYVVLAVLAVVLVGGGVAGFSLYSSAKSMQSQASTIMTDINDIQDCIASGDYAAAQSSAQKVKTQSDKLCEELSSPLWSAATVIPVYGQDVKSVMTLASVLQDASENALVPMTDALAETPPSSLVSSDGSINISSVESLLGSIQTAAPAMQRCTDKMDSLPEMHIDKLSSVVDKATVKLDSINEAFQQANSFAPVIGSILGGNGQRTYLIAAQNSAEIRACGGFPGSCGTLIVDNGKISLGDFGSVWDVMDTSLPDGIVLTDEELAIFAPEFLNKPCDEEYNPDFPRVAEVWAASYSQTTGTHVDGVISMTPAIIQSLLKIVGEVTLSDGTVLNGSNATKILQHDIYWKYLGATRSSGANDVADALFAETADLTFEKVLNNMNSTTMTKLASVLTDSVSDRTLMIWMKDSNEQSKIVEAGCSGAIGADSDNPQVGVFVSNIIPSKLGWYLDIDTSVLKQSVNPDGSATYQVQVKLLNTLTSDEAASAGGYIAGADAAQKVAGQMMNDVDLYAPVGGSMSEVHASNGATFSTATYKGVGVSFSRIYLAPSESVLLTFTVTTAPGEQGNLEVSSTPTLTEYR